MWIAGIVIILFVLCIPLVFVCWMHTASLRRGRADALIVLGYRSDDGSIHPLLKERLDTAIKLFRQYDYFYMMLSGGAVGSDRSEAELMRDYLVKQGIAEERLILEMKSRNTVQNVVNCRQLLRQHGLSTCLLVSNSFHIRRMKYIMKKLGIPAIFYAKRDIRSILTLQVRLTFLEIRAFRLTLPWIEKALKTNSEVNNRKEQNAAG
nr:YdcF family protein [Paenibacillus sp. PL91]